MNVWLCGNLMAANSVVAALDHWREFKHFLNHSSVVSTDSIHVIAGVITMFVASLLLRKPLSHWGPWLVVFACAFLNEILDVYLRYSAGRSLHYGEAVKDVLLTMLLPTLLLFAIRAMPHLFERASGTGSAGAQPLSAAERNPSNV